MPSKKKPQPLKEKIVGEYNRKRSYPFNPEYDIKNTIQQFLNYSFFKICLSSTLAIYRTDCAI